MAFTAKPLLQGHTSDVKGGRGFVDLQADGSEGREGLKEATGMTKEGPHKA